ncbi:hypothetical protein [Pseudofrankia sp. DC12]|uniref:hypothetical protein n=1 Tax=Pseudofrankia sp. DC12 TaxID=683315 RepID=UPI0005F82267|nr:hypothetical protein [Pseudofrankia sp. DC12]
MRAQRALAILLTVLFFALVIFGLGALFAIFHHRVWGYVVGALACAVMVYAGISSLRGSDAPGQRSGPGSTANGAGGGKPVGKGGAGRRTAAGDRPKNSPGAGSGRPGRARRR